MTWSTDAGIAVSHLLAFGASNVINRQSLTGPGNDRIVRPSCRTGCPFTERSGCSVYPETAIGSVGLVSNAGIHQPTPKFRLTKTGRIMAKSRLSKRREAEAAEQVPPATKKTVKKKAAKKKTARKSATTRARRTKDVVPRRRLIWVIYNSTMREEGRYLYHERDKAEERLKQLMSKGKRRYFIQPIKEPLDSDGAPITDDAVTAPKAAVKRASKKTAVARKSGKTKEEADAEE